MTNAGGEKVSEKPSQEQEQINSGFKKNNKIKA